MNPLAAAIVSSVSILDLHQFKKPLPASHGGILYDYLAPKYDIKIPDKIKKQFWDQTLNNYRIRHKAFPLLVSQDLSQNKTCISIYKGELIRAFLYNNQTIFNTLKAQVNGTD